jgi:phytoene dehydrogenase-like protein
MIWRGAVGRWVLVAGGRATGVELSDGRRISSRLVISNADPKRTFLRLLDADVLPEDFLRAVHRIRAEAVSFKLNMALEALPPLEGCPPGTHRGIVDICPSVEYLERAYDDAKYGRPSRAPFLEMVFQSAVDPTVAPPGRHTLTVSCKFAPFHLRGSTWEDEGSRFADVVVATLAGYAPTLPEGILHRHMVTPLDLEREYGLTQGDVFHMAITPDQMFSFRPVPGWSNYRTPVQGLYLCGAGTHPGGGVLGACGHNAAQAVLEDLAAKNLPR